MVSGRVAVTTVEIERESQARTVVARLANRIDVREWDELRTLFADEVTTDYTSLFGGEIQRQSGDALVDMWRTVLSPLDATQHLVGAIEVRPEGKGMVAECHVRGYHIAAGTPGGDEWMIAGQWLIRLAEKAGAWLVTHMTLRTLYQTGNRELLAQAGHRRRER